MRGPSRRRRTAGQIAALAAAGLLFADAGFLYWWVQRHLNGPALARYISHTQNRAIRGRLELGSVAWSGRALVDILRNRPHSVEVESLQLYDPDGVLVLWIPRATVGVDLKHLLRNRLYLYDLRVPEAMALVVEKRVTPTRGELGLLAALAPRKRAPPGAAGAGGGPVVVIRNGRLDGVTLVMDVPGPEEAPETGWGLRLDGLGAGFDLRFDGRAPPPRVDLAFTFHGLAAPAGSLRIGPVIFPLRQVATRIFAVRQSRPDDLEFDVTALAARGRLHAHGRLLRVFGEDAAAALTLHLEDAGEVLRLALGPAFGGPVVGDFDIRGPLKDGATIDGEVRGVEASAGPLRASGVHGRLHLDPARLDLERIEGAAAGGTVKGALRLDFRAGGWSARATLAGLDTGALLDRPTARLLGGRLSGSARADASFDGPLAIRLHDVDLALQRRGGRPLPPRLRARGAATVREDALDLRKLDLMAEGATVTAQGRVLTRRKQLDLTLEALAPRAAKLLAAIKAPPIATALTARARVRGSFDRPRVEGEVTLGGVGLPGRRLDRVTGRLRLHDGLLALEDLRGVGFGGTALGRASLRLFDGSIRRPLADPRLSATLGLQRMQIGRIAGSRDLRGTIEGDVAIEGSLSSPLGHASVRSRDLVAFGDHYTEATMDVDVAQRTVHARRLVLRRQNGGTLEGKGTATFAGALDLDLLASQFPLAAVPGMNELPVALTGLITGQVHVGGDVARPSVGGFVKLLGARLRSILLGDGTVRLEPGGDAVRLSGTFFDRLHVDGYLTLAPRVALFVRIAFTQMPLESLVPELKLIDTAGIATGSVQLSVTKDGISDLQVRLSDLKLWMEPGPSEAHEGRARFELRNAAPITVVYRDDRIELEQLHLTSAAGELRASGFLGSRGSDARVHGSLSLELLEHFARDLFDHVHGDVLADLHVTGPLARPAVTGTLDLKRVALTPREADRPLVIPAGHIDLEPTAAVVRDLRLELDGRHLLVSGRVTLADLRPRALDVVLRGTLSARALRLALPRYLSEADGLIGVDVRARGPWRSPRMNGTITLKHVDLLPRHLGREVVVRSGTIVLGEVGGQTDSLVSLKQLRGTLDDGEFMLDGALVLSDWKLADINVRFRGMGIPHRVPGVYELTVNTDLQAYSDEDRRLRLEGAVDVVDGRYVQRFDLLKDVIEPARTYVEEQPFWRGVPELEELALGLQVQTTGAFLVRNNLADMNLEGSLSVAGTLDNPKLAGEIRTTSEGSFSIPFLRGRFQVQEGGTVSFDRGKSVPLETPEVNIVGEQVFVDSREQEHLVVLTLHGPLGQLQFDLHTNTGLNRAQSLALLSTGRTTDEMRAMVTGRPDTGPQSPAAVAAADQALKTITSDFMSMLIEDPVKRVLRLDLARFDIGTESIEVRLGWRIGRHLKLLGSHELGLLGDSHTDGRAEIKLTDNLLVIPEVERLVRGQQTEQETILRGKAQLKLRLLLR